MARPQTFAAKNPEPIGNCSADSFLMVQLALKIGGVKMSCCLRLMTADALVRVVVVVVRGAVMEAVASVRVVVVVVSKALGFLIVMMTDVMTMTEMNRHAHKATQTWHDRPTLWFIGGVADCSLSPGKQKQIYRYSKL